VSALRQGLVTAIVTTLYQVQQQMIALNIRIERAERAGDAVEAARLRVVADTCIESIGQYRVELQTITGQRALQLET
jgi:hypothetical protein